MAVIQVYREAPCCATVIPNIFIDQYMADANGEFVKIYLYLLRCLNQPEQTCSICTIADHFDHTEKDVLRGLKYWEKVNLIRLEYSEDKKISGIRLLAFPEEAANPVAVPLTEGVIPETAGNVSTAAVGAASTNVAFADGTMHGVALANVVSADAAMHGTAMANVVSADAAMHGTAMAGAASEAPSALTESLPAQKIVFSVPAASAPAVPEQCEFSTEEIEKFYSNDEISELFFIIETYIHHTLSSTETNTVLYWHEDLHFSSDLIAYLVEYCVGKKHTSFRYMNKVALGWFEQKITTVKQAKETAAEHSKPYYAIVKAFGISGRNLAEAELAFLDKWYKEYCFDLELIQEACNRTITAIHQPSFEYADKILSKWFANQVHTKADIEKLDSAHAAKPTKTDSKPKNKNAFHNFDERNYDYDQLEKELLATTDPKKQD